MSQFDHGTLKHDTANVLQNVLKMQDKQVCQIVTSASNMLMLNSDTVLSRSKLEQYTSHGYSHIFVYDKIILPTGCCSASIAAGNHDENAQHDDDDYQILGVLELKVKIFCRNLLPIIICHYAHYAQVYQIINLHFTSHI